MGKHRPAEGVGRTNCTKHDGKGCKNSTNKLIEEPLDYQEFGHHRTKRSTLTTDFSTEIPCKIRVDCLQGKWHRDPGIDCVDGFCKFCQARIKDWCPAPKICKVDKNIGSVCAVDD